MVLDLRHRMPCHSRDGGATRVSVTWRATHARPLSLIPSRASARSVPSRRLVCTLVEAEVVCVGMVKINNKHGDDTGGVTLARGRGGGGAGQPLLPDRGSPRRGRVRYGLAAVLRHFIQRILKPPSSSPPPPPP